MKTNTKNSIIQMDTTITLIIKKTNTIILATIIRTLIRIIEIQDQNMGQVETEADIRILEISLVILLEGQLGKV